MKGGFGGNKPIPLGGSKMMQPPTTAMRRGMGTASGARPMTAVSGAGFSSLKTAGGVPMDPALAGITLEPKVES